MNKPLDLTDEYYMYKKYLEENPLPETEKFVYGLGNLIGKKISNVILNEEKTEITFETDEADYVYYAEAECCSSSWIESVEDIDYLIGNIVLKYEEKQIKEEYESDYECILMLSYDIYTEKGICKIDFRNSSNGYYGGHLKLDEIRYKSHLEKANKLMSEDENK